MVETRLNRRLAAIAAADVVGYSRLMEIDEAGTLSRLKKLRQEVLDPTTERYGGRIFKNTGDGALAEFPSAVDAVQCMVDIQRELGARNADLRELSRDLGVRCVLEGSVRKGGSRIKPDLNSGQIHEFFPIRDSSHLDIFLDGARMAGLKD